MKTGEAWEHHLLAHKPLWFHGCGNPPTGCLSVGPISSPVLPCKAIEPPQTYRCLPFTTSPFFPPVLTLAFTNGSMFWLLQRVTEGSCGYRASGTRAARRMSTHRFASASAQSTGLGVPGTSGASHLSQDKFLGSSSPCASPLEPGAPWRVR